MRFQKLIVGIECVLLNVLVEIICYRWARHVYRDYKPIVKESNVLGDKSVRESFRSSQTLHYEQMVEFIPSFREVQFDVFLLPEPSKGFVQVEDGCVCENLRNGQS